MVILMIIIIQIPFTSSLTSAAATQADQNSNSFLISGFVGLKSDNNNNLSQSKAGFKVEAIGTDLFATTDKDGYYELKIPVTQSVYSLKISKPGYLEREISQYEMNKDTREIEKVLICRNSVIDINQIWAGDIRVNGKQDNVINMLDVIELSKSFNTKVGDEEYNSDADLNGDNVINISDVVIIAQNFNKTSDDYFDIKAAALAIEKAVKLYMYETNDKFFSKLTTPTVDGLLNLLKSRVNIDGVSYGPYLSPDIDYQKELLDTGSSIRGFEIHIDVYSKQVEVLGSLSSHKLLIM